MKKEHPQRDEEVLRGSIKNPWMFGMLVDRYQEAFLRKAKFILHSDSLAEDAVQDTFLKIYKYADRFTEQENASFSSWAYKILSNTCYTYAHKTSLEKSRIDVNEFGDIDAHGNEDKILANEDTSFVHSVMVRLPERFSRLL